jgi:predicted amidophosphoribosyltransferase
MKKWKTHWFCKGCNEPFYKDVSFCSRCGLIGKDIFILKPYKFTRTTSPWKFWNRKGTYKFKENK